MSDEIDNSSIESEKFDTSRLQNSSVWAVYRMKGSIDPDPDYQRQSDVWTKDKKQLLVDTILNRFDVPKLYLHRPLTSFQKEGKRMLYAIVDGKQRLEAIWDFIDGGFALASDCVYFHDSKVKLANLTYSEIANLHPDIKNDFDSYLLDVVVIGTEDIEMIDEMFSRLNEAVTLNAPEKRNAFKGPLPGAIRKLVEEHSFFTRKLPFNNRRYKHYDLCTKFLLSEAQNNVIDTKKRSLDRFVKEWHGRGQEDVDELREKTNEILTRMTEVFINSDQLLRSVGMVALYFHLFRVSSQEGWVSDVTRQKLLEFEKLRFDNRELARMEGEEDADVADKVDLDLLEFDKHAQSPNDVYAIRIRLSILMEKIFSRKYPIRIGDQGN
ncbi:MAG: DUF262 domain-containing protein [Proteobacteria bacterium]|nr:MAG: DUF262 domain-containing protein [Pseudomonadota bacterium]